MHHAGQASEKACPASFFVSAPLKLPINSAGGVPLWHTARCRSGPAGPHVGVGISV